MPFVIVCGGCQRKLKVGDHLAGKAVKCPHCARTVRVQPAASESAEAGSDKAAPSAVKSSAAPAGKKPASNKKTPSEAVKPAPKAKKGSRTPAPEPPEPAAPPARAKATVPPPARSSASVSVAIVLAAGVGLVVVGAGVWYLFFSGPSFGKVSGTVTLGNAPLEAAEVSFVGDNDPRLGAYRAITNKEGKYEIRENNGAGIPVGNYKVFVTKMVMPDGKLPQGPAGEVAREEGMLKSAVAPEFNTATTLRATIHTGDNPLDFQVKAPR